MYIPQRQSNFSSSSGGGNYSKSTTSPYQSQLYDSWKTEWSAPTYHDQFRTAAGPQGNSSGEDQVHQHQQQQQQQRPTRSTYMTKGGRRPSYDDDF